jgi:alkanesulfonate monooxygenase SsuD/methylene tetrahydromethanopterin reductase-like flavin-dependent oxidoreductase (luciferase family)
VSVDRPFEIGLFTFGEITGDPITGRLINPAVRLREFIDLAKLADAAGLDVFGVGEHHRPDFAIASRLPSCCHGRPEPRRMVRCRSLRWDRR